MCRLAPIGQFGCNFPQRAARFAALPSRIVFGLDQVHGARSSWPTGMRFYRRELIVKRPPTRDVFPRHTMSCDHDRVIDPAKLFAALPASEPTFKMVPE
ncbi:MAG: hypothetical protein ABWZ64_03885 [Xanthobacteraceae bacterium]